MKPDLMHTVEEMTSGFAVGNDVVMLSNFRQSFTSDFRHKVYTEKELCYCDSFSNPLLRYASTWAAKEAVYKAIKQLDPSPLPWKKIEIVREKAAGKPSVIIHKDNNYDISLSISHDGDYVWAIVILKVRE
ncbi:MAG TPA: holo-ACP synthase [Sphingobacteriaceae bacterium]